MLNQTVIVGRLVAEPSLQKVDSGKKVANITVAVPRSYKNENGEYDTDFVDCVLWGGIAENTVEFCRKGDMVGVKGRVQTDTYKDEDGKSRKTTKLIAEKVSFLSKSREEETEKTKTKSSKER